MSIQSEINRISGAKSDIADAIEDQGVTVPSGTKLDGMANLIGQISGGSGKLNSTQAADAYDPTATYAVGDKVSYAGNVYSCISAISTPEAWDSTHWDQVDPIQDQVDDLRNTLNHKADMIYDTASGDIASFPDGADGLPVKDLTVGIEPVQDTSGGDPSPTHICPISGWTGCNVTRTGKNLIDHVILGYLSGGVVHIGNDSESGVFFAIAGETYTRSASLAFNKNTIGRVATKNVVDGDVLLESTTQSGDTWTATWTGWTVWYGYSVRSQEVVDSFQIELGASATSYEASHNADIPISWQSSAGTVYGGTLDVTSGVLTVDRVKCVLGGGNLTNINNWYSADVNNQSWGAYLNSGNDIKQIITEDIVGANFLSDQIKDIGGSYGNRAAWTGGIARTSAGAFQYFGIRIAKDALPSVSSADELKAAELAYLNANPIEFVFRIAPQTYQLDPVTVQTLLGQNNVWADTGDSTVEYPADTKLYIQKINTPSDDDMIADANIASGKYFIVNNNLYLSTTAILAGDPIKPGTNCTLTNLAAALNALNS